MLGKNKRKSRFGYFCCILAVSFCIQATLTIFAPSYAQCAQTFAKATLVSTVSDKRMTEHNIKIAQSYIYQRRYELAREHMLLALATCPTDKLRVYIRRQLQNINLQIRTLR